MSKKILVISVVLLALGSGLVPGGILIEDSINDSVVNSIDEGLLGIEEEAIPLIEPMIKEMGIPQALRGIRDVGILFVEDMVEVTFVAVLIEVMAIIGGNISGAFYAAVGMENFFNNDTAPGVWVIFQGVSRFHIQPLNFTEDAQHRILYGNSTTIPGYIPGIQGFLNDTSTGAGVALFLEQYYAANSSDTSSLNITMQENYNCTWNQLTKLVEYINGYLIDPIIPLIISLGLHVEYMPSLGGLNSINAIANALFMEQWANGTILNETLYEGGIDFSEILEGFNETLVGFEVGRVIPSNITRTVAYALFNDTDYPNALTNDTGIEQWITAYSNDTIKNTLMNEFNLTQTQMDLTLYWLFEESFQENIVPELMKLPPPDGVGMKIAEYAKVLLLEQWANGTVLGEILYDYGFPLPLKAGVIFGFEVGYRGRNMTVLPSNMSIGSAESLWDISSDFSLVNQVGLSKWFSALGNPTSLTATELQSVNSLENDEMSMILNWLQLFRDNVMPYLAQEEMNLPSDSTTYANSIELGMVIAGGISIGIGLVGLASNIIVKRKLKITQ